MINHYFSRTSSTGSSNNVFYQLLRIALLCLASAFTGSTAQAAEASPADVDSAPASKSIQHEWQQLLAPFAQIPAQIVERLDNPDDPQQRFELYEFIYNQIASGYGMLLHANADYPDWWPLFSAPFDALWTNPDTIYLASPVDPGGQSATLRSVRRRPKGDTLNWEKRGHFKIGLTLVSELGVLRHSALL